MIHGMVGTTLYMYKRIHTCTYIHVHSRNIFFSVVCFIKTSFTCKTLNVDSQGVKKIVVSIIVQVWVKGLN